MKYKNQGILFKCNIPIDTQEADAYIQRGLDKYGDTLFKIDAEVDGDDIKLWHHTKKRIPFDRIRRITGYLVGTLDRFNDAKREEESNRVKHGVVFGKKATITNAPDEYKIFDSYEDLVKYVTKKED